MRNLSTNKIVAYTLGYGVNLSYLLLMIIILFFSGLETSATGSVMVLLIFTLGTSMILSWSYLRSVDVDQEPITNVVITLMYRHFPALLGVFGSMLLMFG